jgi:membrane-bound serine protease (ClpP class)
MQAAGTGQPGGSPQELLPRRRGEVLRRGFRRRGVKSVAARVAARLTTLAGLCLVCGVFGAAPARAASPGPNVVNYFELTGLTDPGSAHSLLRVIERAGQGGASALIIRVDTPGGLQARMAPIVRAVLDSKVPVIVWVGPGDARARSAGALLVSAAHYTSMSRAAMVGPAEPLDLSVGRSADSPGRTDESAAWAAILRRGKLKPGAVEALRTRSLGSQQAQSLGVVDQVAGSMPDLLQSLKGRTLTVDGRSYVIGNGPFILRFTKMAVLDRLVHGAVRPAAAYFLVLFGLYLLIFELYNPGVGGAGLAGTVSLMFGFYSLTALPTSWASMALILAGMALLTADLRTNRLGLRTWGGFLALAAGSFWLYPAASPALRMPLWATLMGLSLTALFFLSVMTSAVRARSAKPLVGTEGLVGGAGLAKTDISPEGQVMARGTLWRARTLGVAIGRGSPVTIKGIKGLILMVEPAEPDSVVPEHPD